jgi:hypothetical protein
LRFEQGFNLLHSATAPVVSGIRLDNKPRIAALSETTGYVRAFRRACD